MPGSNGPPTLPNKWAAERQRIAALRKELIAELDRDPSVSLLTGPPPPGYREATPKEEEAWEKFVRDEEWHPMGQILEELERLPATQDA